MNAKELIKKRFIEPLMNKKTGNIGVELEFPLLNMDKAPVDENIATKLLEHFLGDGFEVEETTATGIPAFIKNADGDVISYDNSYNNIEFSMNYGDNLIEISNRFKDLFTKAQNFLKPHNYLITGMGINPYKEYITQSHVDYPTYNMIDEFLNKFDCEKTHEYPDFPAYLSSVQTHLDINPEQIAQAANIMSKIGFARAFLFSNSYNSDNGGMLCYRDYLWENSAFGLCSNITGKVDDKYNSLDDILKSFLGRSIFNRIRNGKYEIFEPVTLEQYFENPKYKAEERDIEQFLSFRDIEITARGTLEIRGDCAQPLYDAFAPSAFALGVAHNIDEANDAVNTFFKKYWLKSKNSVLRNKVIKEKSIKGIYNFDIADFLEELISISEKGLKMRNNGEEILIKSLYTRAENFLCPAKIVKEQLEKGKNIDELIIDYSTVINQ